MYRTQPAVSVEAAFFVVVEVSDDDLELDGSALPESDLPESDFEVEAPFSELVPALLLADPESPLTDVIEEDSEPRLSVL
jgi:hypothetical protein